MYQCTVGMFDKLTSLEWSDFIWAHNLNVLMKKDITSNKRKVRVCIYYAVKHSSTAAKDQIFNAHIFRDKPNTLTLLPLTSPRNAILTTHEVEPFIMSFLEYLTNHWECLPYYLVLVWIRRMCQLFEVEYLWPLVTVTNEMKSNETF